MRIAAFGGSFNPPGLHHRAIAEALATRFDRVDVMPCGPRPDKPTVDDVDPAHRAAMAHMTFDGIRNTRVDDSDLEEPTFTRTYDLDRFLRGEGEPWHVIGTDLIQGGRDGASVIQREWAHGQELWERANFVVLVREGYPFEETDLPPHHLVIPPSRTGASSEIRRRVFDHQPIAGLVMPEVERYIERRGLYRGGSTRRGFFPLISGEPRLVVVHDPRDTRAAAIAEQLAPFTVSDPYHDRPNAIVAIGGDGTMLGAMAAHWRLRVPFIGFRTGRRGFLLNDPPEVLDAAYFNGDFDIRWSPGLHVESWAPGTHMRKAELTFNDAWIERASPQTAWVEVQVNGQVRVPVLRADGAIVATSFGSTGYARVAGANPIPIGTPNLVLAGLLADDPFGWRPELLQSGDTVEFRSADPFDPPKRPLRAIASGVDLGQTERMVVRSSRVAAVELALTPDHDLQRRRQLERSVAGESR